MQLQRTTLIPHRLASTQTTQNRSRNRTGPRKKRGKKPSPGTIYPVLKNLTAMGILTVDQDKRYSITEKGQTALEASIDEFVSTFYDLDEMKSCMSEKKKSDTQP
jgi:Predicted transcriptional regulators